MDIADIGFRVDTSDLAVAQTKLNALTPAAVGAQQAATKLATAVEGASASIVSATTAAARAEAVRANAMLKTMQVSGTATKEEIAAARAIQQRTKAALTAAQADEARVRALNSQAQALRKVEIAAKAAAGAQQAVSAATPTATGPALVVNNGRSVARDAAPNKFNTANIAAQFQDIGVTAAMGMNPLQIALQQGTQLAAIMNSMQNPAKGLAEALKQVFNVVSLGTIAIVAIIAAMLQFVNWTTVAQYTLNGLADAIQYLLPWIGGIAAAFALIYAPAIISGIAALSVQLLMLGRTALVAGGQMAAAWIIAMGPFGWVMAGILLVGAAFQLLGVDILGYMKTAVNGIIGFFVGAFNAIKATWKMLPAVMGDLVIQAANLALKNIEKMINGSIEMINGLVNALPEEFRPKGGLITWKADIQIDNPFEGKAAEAGKVAGDEFAKAFKQDYVGEAGKFVQGLADSAANSIRKFSNSLDDEKAKKQRGKTPEEKYDDILKGADRKIATLKAERDAIGMTEFATAKLKFETELLNEAQQKGITLTAAGRAELMGRANDMAVLTEQIRKMKAAYEFVKDVAKGFFQDMKQGLQEGKGLWESFANAVTNALNKILDKMLDSGLNMIYDGLFGKDAAGNQGAGAGILEDIGNYLFSAKGNAFNSSGVVPFAKGGAFSNSVVSSPTMFAFANGGKFGVMGEAGAEAVMPLHRGPDGSLGVKMSGSAGNDNNVQININNYGSAKVSTTSSQGANGMEIDVMIDEAVAQKISDQGSATNRSLNARDSRRLIAR